MVTDPLVGRVVDSRYEIVGRVARGGMATVYSARDRRLDRVVALKLMHPHLADSPDFVARFRREARAAARLSNPGVVAVYDQGSLDGVAYLVMELVTGPNLRDLIAAGPLSVREALGLTAQVLAPLGAAHRAGLVHRDIKPENVLLPSDGSVAKVADFGLARAVTEATQTTTGNVLGTAAYLAPELITSGASGPRADVYSTGVILYELLTGTQPFSGDTPISIAFRNVHEDVPPPSAVVPEIPAQVDALVHAMTRREAADRLEDADAALAALRATVDGLTASELSVRRGGGSGSLRAQEVLAANADAARRALSTQDEHGAAGPALAREAARAGDGGAPGAPAVQGARGARGTQGTLGTPGAGLRTVSLPIGSIGPSPSTGSTRAISRDGALGAGGTQPTQSVPRHQARGTRRRSVIAAGALMLLGGGAAGAWYLTRGPGRTVVVPEIAGRSAQDAQAAVEALGLAWGTTTRAYSDTVATGSVISCEPDPGARLHLGQAVSAVVSRGVEQKTVPSVAGLTQDEAEAAIGQAGLSVGAITQEYSQGVASGEVISSTPAAGEKVDHSSAVAIVLSRGRQPASVPDVTGMTPQQATTTLEAAGLVLGSSQETYSDDVAAGLIVSSSPSGGASAYVGDAVDVSVSKGPEMVTVPSVSGMSQEEAEAALTAAGLQVEVSDVLGGLFGTAHSTDPAEGESVRKGSTVTLYVV